MNDSTGKPLAVGQRITFHEYGAPKTFDESRQPTRTWTGTIEHLVPARTSHPSGGGATLTSGKKYPAASALNAEQIAAFQAIGHGSALGAAIPDGTPAIDTVIAAIDPDLADAQKVQCDHDLSAPCAAMGTTSDQNDCPCPSRMWVPAALVTGA